MDESSIQLIMLFVLLVLSIIFSSSETALTSLNKIRLRNMLEEGVKGADTIDRIMQDQKKLLTTILIGNNIVNISASALATSIAIKTTNNNSSAVALVTAVLTLLILIFGEVTPKTIATQNAEKVSLMVAPFIEVCILLFSPIAYVVNFISGIFIKLFGVDIDKKQETITEAELKTIVNVSHEEGVLEVDERRMINNIFDFGDQLAKEIMTPRTDMVAVSVDATYDEVMDTFRDELFSRVPVYRDSIDDIIGILYLKDLVFGVDKESFSPEDYVRKVFFTYESKQIGNLFTHMKSKRISMAVVLDEYGGTAGILTLQDIVEEIFGDIHDEDDDVDLDIQKISETEYIVDGVVKLDDLNEDIKTEIVSEDFESIGGYVVGLFGQIPKQNAEIISEEYNLLFKVIEIDKNRVEKVQITILNSEVSL